MATAEAEEQLKLQQDLNALERDYSDWQKELQDREAMNALKQQERDTQAQITENIKKAKEEADAYNTTVSETVNQMVTLLEKGVDGQIEIPVSLKWLDEDQERLFKQLGESAQSEPASLDVEVNVVGTTQAQGAVPKDTGKDVNKAIADSVDKNTGIVKDSAAGIIDSIIAGMKEQFEKFKPFSLELYNELRSRIDDQPWKNLGYNMIMGMVNGIMLAMQPLIDAVLQNIRAAMQAGRSELGIASPAKETIKDGVNWVLGYIGGIEKAKPQLMTTIKGLSLDMLSQPLSNLATGYAPTPIGVTPGAQAAVTNQYYSIYPQKMTYSDMNQFYGEVSRAIATAGV